MHFLKITLWLFTLHWGGTFQARELPTVEIPTQGTIMAMRITKFRTQRVLAYLGIPFAHAPIDTLRFAPPVINDLPSWTGIRNSTIQAECWQDVDEYNQKRHEVLFAALLPKQDERMFDEDCLFLNIYVPDAPPPPDGFAVLVWLHSGDFNTGSPHEIDPFYLVLKQKLMVVTFSYRLNVFGFLTTMDGEAPGNFGLMDQSAALLWVSSNIHLFGGNNTLVTLAGQGSGAISTSLHLTSGHSADTFQKAIVMSGSSLLDLLIPEPRRFARSVDDLAKEYGCLRNPTVQLMICLRRVSAEVLLKAGQSWGPIIDGNLSNDTQPFIEEDPRILVQRGMIKKVPVLIGYTNMEEALVTLSGDMLKNGVSEEMYMTLVDETVRNQMIAFDSNDTEACNGNEQLISEAVNFLYKPPEMADAMYIRQRYIEFTTEREYVAPSLLLAQYISKNSPAYVYRFDIKPRTNSAVEGVPEWMGVPNKFDLIFVWGLPYWSVLANNTQWDPADKRVSDIIMTLWANFIKYTNPTHIGVYIKWEPFVIDTQGVLIIDRSFNMSSFNSFNYQSVKFWNSYFPRVMELASQCCNSTDTGGCHSLTISFSSSHMFLLVSVAIITILVNFMT